MILSIWWNKHDNYDCCHNNGNYENHDNHDNHENHDNHDNLVQGDINRPLN